MAKLALALDLESGPELLSWAQKIKSHRQLVLKIGLGLLPELGEDDFKALKDQGHQLFIDAKLHDIPSQVAKAVQTWQRRGADYLTLHVSGGSQMIKDSVEVARGTGTKLLGVTVLTSLNDQDLKQIGFKEFQPLAQVTRLVDLALDSGLENFVCSVGEIKTLRERCRAHNRKGFATTPGLVTVAGQRNPDQQRVFTVEEALQAGSDLLVVGRSITRAKDPAAEIQKVLELLKEHDNEDSH